MTSDGSSDPKPGEVWRVDLNPSKGSETGKVRPAIVVSASQFSTLPVRLIVPVTGWDDKHLRYIWRVPIEASQTNGLTKKSAADCGQVRVVSLGRFKDRLEALSPDELSSVRLGLAIAMDVEPPIDSSDEQLPGSSIDTLTERATDS